MCEIKRGAVLLIQAGRKMSNDLSRPFGAPSPEGEGLGTGRGLTEAQRREVVRGVKEAVGNTKGPEDYALLRFEAEMEYGESLYEPGPMARLAEALLGAYALTVYRLHEFFRRERKSATSGQHIWLCGRVAATGRHGLGQPTDWEGSWWHGR